MDSLTKDRQKRTRLSRERSYRRKEFQEYLNGVYASLISAQYNMRQYFELAEIREFTGLVEKIKQYGEKL